MNWLEFVILATVGLFFFACGLAMLMFSLMAIKVCIKEIASNTREIAQLLRIWPQKN